jgi:hypothetical protein
VRWTPRGPTASCSERVSTGKVRLPSPRTALTDWTNG